MAPITKFTHWPEDTVASNIPDRAVVSIVGHAPFSDVIERGVVINFYPAGKNVRFEINPNALTNIGLQVRILLPGCARIVDPVSGEL